MINKENSYELADDTNLYFRLYLIVNGKQNSGVNGIKLMYVQVMSYGYVHYNYFIIQLFLPCVWMGFRTALATMFTTVMWTQLSTPVTSLMTKPIHICFQLRSQHPSEKIVWGKSQHCVVKIVCTIFIVT